MKAIHVLTSRGTDSVDVLIVVVADVEVAVDLRVVRFSSATVTVVVTVVSNFSGHP